MRILYALDSYRPSIDGVGVSIERQAIGLASRGHEVAIIAPGQDLTDSEEKEGDLTIFRVRAVKILLDKWRLAVAPRQSVERAITRFAPNVVVVNLPLLLNWTSAGLAKKHGLPLVGITGTMPEWILYSIGMLRPLSRFLHPKLWKLLTCYYNQCDLVVAVTPTALGYLNDHGLTKPSRVISNGVQLDKFCPQIRDEDLAERLRAPEKPTVLYAGRLDAEKCMDVWVKAIPHILREVDAHFIIGGDGADRPRIEEMVTQLGISQHVTFPGFLGDDSYHRLYSLASVFAITSPAELQSIVTLEAAASGLPIVAVNAGALPELVQTGRNGFLFEPGNSEEMARYIVRLLKDPVQCRRMGRESRVIAHQHDLNSTVREYERAYEEVTNGRSVGLSFRLRQRAQDETRP